MKQAYPTPQPIKLTRNYRFAFSVVLGGVICLLSACSPPPPDHPVAAAPVKTPVETAAASNLRDTAYMMKRMGNPASMAVLHASETVEFASSHNTGELIDADVFQGAFEDGDRQWSVLFNGEGPGCITRIWLSGNVSGSIRIYFDDEPEPRIDAPIRDFFAEKVDPFTTLFVYNSQNSGGGNVCYMPMPYEKSCRIAIESGGNGVQYQVQAVRWGDGVQTKTFSPVFDNKTQQAKAQLFKYISSTADQHFQDLNKRAGSLTLAPDSRTLIASLQGPAAIQYLQFTTTDYTMDAFMKLRLTIYWDSLVEPAVDCTLAEFFNVVDASQGWSIPAYGYLPHKKMLVTQIYMPFQEEAQIFIESTHAAPVKLNFEYRLNLEEVDQDAMYFYAQTLKREGLVGNIYPVFEYEGRGRYMGCSVKTISAEYGDEKHYYFEGDDYIYIDGEQEATIQGSGLDNYINGYNRIKGALQFWGPTHGCRMKDDFQGGRSYCFRYHYLDSVPFQTSLMRIQEMGCPVQASGSDLPVNSKIHFEWVHYWYGKPKSAIALRDEQLFHFIVNQNEDDQPSVDSPLVIGDLLYIKMQPGDWWIHYAPVWDMNQVIHLKKSIDPEK